ncbi:MAG: AbgT family transporter [Acidobacteriia bacterium]|nr:AbgT family transporter [Terriglobia bacterium]MYG02787.1 AbgT family transporter [Terriglobia bacterium]MYK12107.1 AbgT family transporter [Terriglobia bacterium]
MTASEDSPPARRTAVERALYWVERVGNRLPDPAALFVVALVLVWIASLLLAGHEFTVPAKDGARTLVVQNQLSGSSLAEFLASMVTVFTGFAPLGVVLVALLGVGVAEHTGFIRASLKGLVSMTPRSLLSPMLLLVAIISHTAADVGYVLVIPLGGVIFHAAGRHPLAGIACAFAGVSGGFGANFIPSAIDPLLQGFTQSAAQILDSGREVNPLCNWLFTSVSSALVIVVGWILTDRVIEPRLKGTALDGEGSDSVEEQALSRKERTGVWAGLVAMALGVLALFLAVLPADSPLRAPNGQLSSFAAPLMQSMIPLIFLLFLIPGTIYGYVAGTVKSHRDIITGMSKSMSTMGYYLTMIFFCAQFTAAFAKSNLGALLAVEGAEFLKALGLPGMLTIGGIIVLSAFVNLLVGSASGKWALLAPVFVPVLMQVGLSPELTQAAYRVGDSTTNIVTPLMPYFPLVVAFCQRWVKNTGIGTVTSLMLPYSITLLITWSLALGLYWALGIPLGLQSTYTYP